MNIKQTIITATVALTMVAMIAPMSAGALTTADLQAQINALMAQLNQLQGTTTSASVPSACVGITFTRNLKVGSVGSDVKCLQALLNTSASTQISTTGAGSPGNETTTFGPKTLLAVHKYQSANGLTPAAQVGPMTRAKLNAWLGGSTTTTTTTTPVPSGNGLTVMLASNNPSAGTVVRTQGLAPLAKFTFVNGDNASVKVTGLKVARIGVSADTSLSNVYLLNGSMRLTDAASVSSGVVNFNDSTGLFTVPSMGSVTITVASDLNASSGETLGVAIVAATSVTSNASTVKGNFPVNGNLMTVASATLAGVQFASSTTPSTNTSLNPQNGYVVWQNSTVVTTRTVNLTRIAFRLIGSVNYSDLQNFVLNIDGVNIGSPVQSLDSNGYVTFDETNSPVALQTGTRLIKVLADIVGGSSRNFYFSIRVAADANFVDSQYGVNVAPTTATGVTTFVLSDVTTGTQTIASGTMTFIKTADSPSGNITNNASNAVLARWKLTSAGEKTKIMNLSIDAGFINASGPACSTSTAAATLRNGALYANGVQVGSTTNVTNTGAGTQFNFGSSLIVDPLNPVILEFRADVYDNGNATNCITSGDTIQPNIISVASNAQGMVSLTTLTTPTSNTPGNQLTVAVGALTLSKYLAYTNQTVVPPLTSAKLGHFTLTNGTVEAINLNTIYADLTLLATHTTNLWVKYGTSQTTPISNPSATSLANAFSINRTLAVGETIDIAVYGDVDANITVAPPTVGYTSVKVLGTTALSGTSVSAGLTPGQNITFTSGSATATIDGTTPQSAVVAGNQSVTAAKFKFTSTNDSYTITEAKFTVKDANNVTNGAVVNTATIWDGNTALATQPYDSTNNWIYFTGLSVPVPANTNKVLTVSLSLATPYTDGSVITTGKNLIVAMSYIKALNSQGQVKDSVAGVTLTGATGNYLYVYKTVPTVTVGTVSGQGVNLTSGSTTNLYNFTIGADAKGPVAVRQIRFNVSTNNINGAPAVLSNFKLFRGSTDLVNAGIVTIVNGTTDLTGSNTIGGAGNTVTVVFYPEETIPAGSSISYTLKATPAGFATSTSGADSVSTSIQAESPNAPAGTTAGYNQASFYLSATGNTAAQTLYTAAGHGGGDTPANFIWSDNSAQSHSAVSATSSGDWFNGYFINNLPLDAVGIVSQ